MPVKEFEGKRRVEPPSASMKFLGEQIDLKPYVNCRIRRTIVTLLDERENPYAQASYCSCGTFLRPLLISTSLNFVCNSTVCRKVAHGGNGKGVELVTMFVIPP